MQLQVKLEKTEEIMFLKANKEQTRYRLIYLHASKSKKRYDWCFERKMTEWKGNVTFLAVKN